MKNTRLILVAAGALSAGAALLTTSLAQTGTDKPAAAAPVGVSVRVAACDLVEVFNNYARAKDMANVRDEKLKGISAERERRQKDIDAIRIRLEGLKKDSPQYEKDINDMQEKTIGLSSWMQFQEALILREHYRLTKEMYGEILRMVEKVGKERGVQLVLDRQRQDVEAENTSDLLRQMERRKVLYCDESLDLTETVLLRINEAYRLTRPKGK
jgi:Skp family chaperone for outer membrane proteins